MRTAATLSVIVAAVTAAAAGASGHASSSELFHPGAAGTGEAFVDASGRVVTLNGLDQQPVWSGGLTPSASLQRLRQAREAGFDSMRYVLFWNLMEPAQGSFAHLADLDRALANAKAAGIRVILELVDASQNMAHIPRWARTGRDTVADINANGKAYVQALVRRYANDPTVVAYDPVNEPRQSRPDNTRVLRMYQTIIGWIRPLDRDKIVQIEPTWGTTSLGAGCADWSVLTSRANLEIQVHDYYGGGGTGNAGWNRCVSDGTQMWRPSAAYRSSSQGQLEAHVKRYLSDASYARLPVYVGEFSDKKDVVGHDQWIRDTVAALDRNGLSRAWWQYHTTGSNSATDFDTWAWFPWVRLLTGETVNTRPQPTLVLPDPAITPGAYNSEVRESTIERTICVSRWAKTMRPPLSYLNALKREQLARYDEGGSAAAYEEDHLIPIELGGAARNAKNLWPEPRAQAKASNRLETKLRLQVCRGAIPLAKARRAIRSYKFANG